MDVSGLVSGVVFELGSSFVHVSDPVGVICKLGFELPFASMFNEIGMDCSSIFNDFGIVWRSKI